MPPAIPTNPATSSSVMLHKRCRACGENLIDVLSLGHLRLNAFPEQTWEITQSPRVPLILTTCLGCGLLQLDRTVPADWLYRRYWYRSGVNESMVQELHTIVGEALAAVGGVGSDDVVYDIGANDGTLLAAYQEYGVAPRAFAWEPAYNLHARLIRHASVILPTYFPNAAAEAPPAKIITAIACAYDVEDPLAFFQGIATSLREDGVAIVQFQDFAQQLLASAFDNICHEHLEYYTLWSLRQIALQAGLWVDRVQTTPINGGSLRVTLRRMQGRVLLSHPSVAHQMAAEAALGLDTPTLREGNLQVFSRFSRAVEQAQERIAAAVKQILDDGRVLDIYGASTKGNILLQVLDIGPATARQAIDRSPEKHGCHTITGIPIVSEEQARVAPADVWLCPIWQFRESVLRREAWYLEQGGTIIFPLPTVEVVRQSWRAAEA